MQDSIHPAEGDRFSAQSRSLYEERFRKALDAWIADIQEISKAIYGTADGELLARIDKVIEEASRQLYEQLGWPDITVDIDLREKAYDDQRYVEILCPVERGRNDLKESLERHWSNVILESMCVGKQPSVLLTYDFLNIFRYRVLFAVKKKGNVPFHILDSQFGINN